MNPPTERHKKIYRLRMSGASFTHIGKELGVSRGRAQQLFVVAKQRVEQHENILPERLAVILDNLGCMDGLEPDFDKLETILADAGLLVR